MTRGPLGPPSNRKSPTYRAHEMQFPGCSCRNPLAHAGALEQRRLCSTRGWASENNFLTVHRKFKAVYSERPHNVAFMQSLWWPEYTAPTWGICGVHFKLRNMITMHMFIASVHNGHILGGYEIYCYLALADVRVCVMWWNSSWCQATDLPWCRFQSLPYKQHCFYKRNMLSTLYLPILC